MKSVDEVTSVLQFGRSNASDLLDAVQCGVDRGRPSSVTEVI